MQGILANLEYVVALPVESLSSNFRQVGPQMDVLSSCYGVIFVQLGVKINGSY